MKNKRTRKTYDRDFKVSAMKLILATQQRVAKVSIDYWLGSASTPDPVFSHTGDGKSAQKEKTDWSGHLSF